MRTIKSVLTAVLILIVLVLTGCYMDTPTAQVSDPIVLQPRGIFDNFDGNGEYISVRMYKTAVVDSLLDGPSPAIAYAPNGSLINYDFQLLPAPEMIYAGFLGPVPNPQNPVDPYPSGTLVIPYVPAGSYRFLVERGSYSVIVEPPYWSYGINYAEVTGAYSVNAGEDVEISIQLIEFGGW